MGRKKKSRTSNANDSPVTPSIIYNDGEVKADIPPEDWLDLRLVSPQSGLSRDSQKESIVYLMEQDAYRIDVINGDSVLLLARETHGSKDFFAATALCSVRINVNGAAPNKVTSPRRTPGKQSIRLSQGTCRVFPNSLAEHLCFSPEDESVSNVDASIPETPIMTPSASQNTPPASPSLKTSFSFARGGGGNKLISPSSQTKPLESPRTPSARSTSRGIWLVPLQCPLGERLSKMVCCDASRISLCLPTDENDVVYSKSERVLQRLVLANHVGRYVHQGETIGISFQGKMLELKVQRVETKCAIDEICSEMANVELNNTTANSQNSDLILNAIRRSITQEDDSVRRIRMYKLSYATEIVLVHDEIESSDALDMLQTKATNANTPDKPPLQVVAGLDATLQQVKSLLLPPLMRSDLFKNHSLRPPRGILLYGSSGCGKSLLAEQVKLDLESDVYVQTINCTSLQSRTSIVGEAERHLTRIFQTLQQVHEKAGTLLILDDIHLICPKRGRNNQGADRLAATLLALLDGIGAVAKDEDRGNLVVLGIASNPSLLDPALRRPGRLDAEVEVPIPDELSRAEILRFQLERLKQNVSIPELTEEDYMALSRLAKGFNGADVMLAIKEALRKSIASSSDMTDPNVILLTRPHLEASIRATKPSTISSITVEIPQVHWSSIGGMDGVKQKLRESIELPITHAHLFEALNIPPPRGVLLFGPPGCSKTLMARALATEGQMNFLAVKGPELLSKWLGESERALASLFRRARMASPCIIFFDEIDAIASKRGGGEGSAGGERLLSQLLTELDGIRSSSSIKQERVIVVGATNRPDLLDSALTRPGRIDRMIYVGLPDERSREQIFEIGLKGKACSSDIQISILASDEMSGGFSGAELIAICRDAALLAIEEDDEREEGSPQIAMRHLTRAIEEMQRQITPEMLDFYASFNTLTI